MHTELDTYTLAVDDLDWRGLAPEWDWVVPPDVAPRLMTAFGDVFLVTPSRDVLFLDLENGTCEAYANDPDSLLDTISADEDRTEILLSHLVDRLLASRGPLPPGSCYHFKIPTILGGDFTLDNVAVIDVAQRIRFCGDFHRQIKDLPDGAPVKLKIVP